MSLKVYYDYQIFNEQKVGGISRYFIKLEKEISKSDKYTSVIKATFHKNLYLKSGVKVPNIRIVYNRIGNTILKKVNQYFSYKYIKKFNPDIIHSTWFDSYIYKIDEGIKVVTIYDMIHELFMEKTPLILSEIEGKKIAIHESDKIIAISESTKNDILKIYPEIDENKIKVIYLGVNHLEKKSTVYEKAPSRYILFVGRRLKYKGIDLFNKLMVKLADKYDDMSFVFSGEIKPSKKEKKYYREKGIWEKIHFLNPTDAELAYLYENAECFVYPSRYEGFGLPILEAFDNDCPVVCTNSSSLPEVGGDAALYFKVDDLNECYKQVVSIIEDKKFRDELIKRGRERLKIFSWEKTAKETMLLYDDVLKEFRTKN